MAGDGPDAREETAWTELPIEPWDGPTGEHVEWSALEWEQPRTEKKGFARLFAGRFGRLLLPAIIAQSILIGGGYASGREVVEFGARFGSAGWIAVVTIFVGFVLVSVLVFEFARVTRAYDYKSFMRGLIGPAWPLFDLVYAAMAILVIAVMASAAGTIMETTLGLPAFVGILAIVVIVGLLTYHGARLIEAFKTIGTALLYIGYMVFGIVVLTATWPDVVAVFDAGDTTHAPGVTTGTVIGAGVLYVGYNLAIYPAVLFTLHRQGSRRDSVIAGLIAGATMTLPFLVTYLCVLGFYNGAEVVGAEVPWLPMLDAAGGAWLVGLFGLVVGWTLLETSVGLIHAILDRVERGLVDQRSTFRLQGWHKGLLGALGLAAAALLSQLGVVGLVAKGYTAMGYAFLALFALPLLTVGVLRIFRPVAQDSRTPPRTNVTARPLQTR